MHALSLARQARPSGLAAEADPFAQLTNLPAHSASRSRVFDAVPSALQRCAPTRAAAS